MHACICAGVDLQNARADHGLTGALVNERPAKNLIPDMKRKRKIEKVETKRVLF